MKEHTLSWEEINKTNTNSTQRCISQRSYKVCRKMNPSKVRNSSIYVFITLNKFGPEFTKCLVPNSPGPKNIWSRIHHLVPSSLGPEFTWYLTSLSFGIECQQILLLFNQEDLEEYGSRDRSGPRPCDFDATFSKMAQIENWMGSIWRIEIKFNADCQVYGVTLANDYRYISLSKMKVKVTPRVSRMLTQGCSCFEASQ